MSISCLRISSSYFCVFMATLIHGGAMLFFVLSFSFCDNMSYRYPRKARPLFILQHHCKESSYWMLANLERVLFSVR